MSDKGREFLKDILYKYGLLIAIGLYFIYTLFFTPPVTKEQIEAEGTDPANAPIETTVTDTTAADAALESVTGAAQSGLSAVDGKNIKAYTDEQGEALRKAESEVTEDGEYTSMAEVAAYIHLYGKLPSNFISKTKAKEQGWEQSEGNLQDVLPGKSIGGSVFYNDENILPEKDGRVYTECDIDYTGGKRNAKRIIFSDDGLVFYTEDHYATYTQLY